MFSSKYYNNNNAHFLLDNYYNQFINLQGIKII